MDDVFRLSGGNPFFVEELVAARAAGVTGFPETLRDVVLALAGTLDDTSFAVLGVVAAAGSTAPAVLADVCGLDEISLATTIDVLVAAALLVLDGEEVRFRHELARAVFYGELAPGERARTHGRLALSCEALRPERPGDIARHWSGGPRPATRAHRIDCRRSPSLTHRRGRGGRGLFHEGARAVDGGRDMPSR